MMTDTAIGKRMMTNAETRKRMLEVLDETVQYYSEDVNRRSSDDDHCYYYGPGGNMCAVGRCLEDPKGVEDRALGKGIRALCAHIESPVFKPAYQGLPIDFWSDLQELHDEDFFWSDEGLTEAGKQFVAEFKQSITTGV